MAELADAHGSGPCGSNTLRVRLPSSAGDEQEVRKLASCFCFPDILEKINGKAIIWNNKERWGAQQMLELKHLSFEVNDDKGEKGIIKDISLKVNDGKFVVITGPNGGGKSTQQS